MDYELLKPWVVVGGYLLAFGLLALSNRFDGRPTLRRGLLWAAGALASVTSLYWLTWGTFSGPAAWLWAIFPLAVAAFVWWRRYRRGEWTDRVAGRDGRVFSRGNPGRPSFGVLPSGGLAVDAEDERAGFEAAVEFDHAGQRVLGVEYTLGQRAQAPTQQGGKFVEAVDMAGNTFSLVQLRTPAAPTLVVAPRTTAEQQENHGPLELSEIRPFQDARLTRNVVGALTPDTRLLKATLDDDAFSRRFSVRAADPEQVARVLTPEIRQLLVSDPWFHVREVVFHHGALWTTRYGAMSERELREDADNLSRLAAAVPSDVWRSTGDAETERFLAQLAAAEAQPAAAASGGLGRFNARRRAAGRAPMGIASFAVRAVCVLALVIPGASMLTNAVLAVTGVAPQVQLTVTDVKCDQNSNSDACGDLVSGTYERNGERHTLVDETWLAWRSTTEPPVVGDVVEVRIGPLWWHPMIETTGVGIFLLIIGLGLVITGLLAGKLLFNLAPKASPQPASQV